MYWILNDWLIEVAPRWRINEPALFVGAEIMGAYFEQNPSLPRKRLQLLGMVALTVASKIIQEHSPEVEDMVYMTNYAYTEDEVRSFEQELLPFASKAWTGWGPVHFLAHYVEELRLSQRDFTGALMCLECSVLVYKLRRHAPSLLAAAACLCARLLFMCSDLGMDSITSLEACSGPSQQLSSLCGRASKKINEVAAEICRVVAKLEAGFVVRTRGSADGTVVDSLWRKYSAVSRQDEAPIFPLSSSVNFKEMEEVLSKAVVTGG